MKYSKPRLHKTSDDTVKQYCSDGSTTAASGCSTGTGASDAGNCSVGDTPLTHCIAGPSNSAMNCYYGGHASSSGTTCNTGGNPVSPI